MCSNIFLLDEVVKNVAQAINVITIFGVDLVRDFFGGGFVFCHGARPNGAPVARSLITVLILYHF